MDAKPTAGAVTDDAPAPQPAPGRAEARWAGASARPQAPGDPGVPEVRTAAAPEALQAPHAPQAPHASEALGAAGGPYLPPGPPAPTPAPPRPLARRLVAPLGTLAGVAAAFAYVGTVDPNEPGHYPVCPLLRFTGVYCPGCGGLRSAHAFVHGELGTAFGANALAVVGYGLFAVVMALWLVRAVRGVPMRLAISPAWWWGIGAVLALFTLVRNLPFGSALAP
ncbi:DUF2752 domain-containing protein [Streptomyces vilmorinianum]|uniref:DUF2752 domain-containing protein n=1 Tax=Streptomyces vilmorinianum TaxID=3051092 RepID=UPI003D81AD34